MSSLGELNDEIGFFPANRTTSMIEQSKKKRLLLFLERYTNSIHFYFSKGNTYIYTCAVILTCFCL